jgi:hypothetical protein
VGEVRDLTCVGRRWYGTIYRLLRNGRRHDLLTTGDKKW